MRALADLVRATNCYYSNLIEGHDIHPIDIERALKNDYSADPKKRNLQPAARTPEPRDKYRQSALIAPPTGRRGRWCAREKRMSGLLCGHGADTDR
jgi:hypothetical protein